MKFLISWTVRPGIEGVEESKKAMQVFGKWSPDPSITFHQFVQRTDGSGGYAFVETDNAKAMLRDALTFGTWFDFQAIPVVDMLDAASVQQEVIDLIESIV